MTFPPLKRSRRLARKSHDVDALIFQLVKAFEISRTVNKDGVRLKHADHLTQTLFKAISIAVFMWTASDSSDTYDAVFRNSVKAVPICLIGTPTNIVDNSDATSAEPVAHQTHSVCSVDFEWFRKVLIG